MRLVGPSGLEPPTSCLSGTRSNHLSYEPVFKCRMQNAECRMQSAELFASLGFLLSPLLRWWRWWDSNPWPPACRAGALPAELHPHICSTNEKWCRFAVMQMLRICEVLGFAFSPKRSFKIEQRIERTLTKPSFYVAYTIVMHGRFSIERRWSSRTFRYGYLVTT